MSDHTKEIEKLREELAQELPEEVVDKIPQELMGEDGEVSESLLMDDKPAHLTIVDPEHLDFISHLSRTQYSLLTRLRIRALFLNDELLQQATDMLMRMSTSIEGRRTDQIIEAVAAEHAIEGDPNLFVDSIGGEGLQRQEGGVTYGDS